MHIYIYIFKLFITDESNGLIINKEDDVPPVPIKRGK